MFPAGAPLESWRHEAASAAGRSSSPGVTLLPGMSQVHESVKTPLIQRSQVHVEQNARLEDEEHGNLGDNIDKVLRERDTDQVIVTVIGTNIHVESTARDALSYGFHALTVSNTTAALSQEETDGEHD